MNYIPRFSIHFKLILLAINLFAGLAFYGLFSYYTTQKIKIKGNYYNQIILQKELADIIPPPEFLIESYLTAFQEASESNPQQLEELLKKSNQLRTAYYERFRFWESKLTPGEARNELLEKSHQIAENFFNVFDREFLPALAKGDREGAFTLLQGQLKDLYNDQRKILERVVELAKKEYLTLEKAGEELYNDAENVLLTTWIVTVILVSIAAYFVGRSITQGLRRSVNVLTSASNEIKEKIDQQSQTVVQQSSSVHETTAAMDELNASFEHTGALAREGSDKAKNTLNISEEGNMSLKQMMDNLNNHRSNVNAIGDQIMRLSELTRQIHNIASVINNLTNQTNILSLIAAVQAAHVKEHGEGFSVVAAEIRKLADESKQFLNRIDKLAGDIGRETDEIVRIGAEGTKTINECIVLAHTTSQAFDKVTSIANLSVESAEQVALNVNQQASGVTQVLEAMEHLSDGTKQTSAGMNQVKSALKELDEITEALHEMI